MSGFADWTEQDVNARNAKIGKGLKAQPKGLHTEVVDHARAPKSSKYRNVRVDVHGERFDSKREAEYWVNLKMREAVGEIRDLRRQVPFPLYAPARAVADAGVHVEVARYIADFTFIDTDGRPHYLDAKGTRTRLYALKKKWLELQDGIVIEEV